MVAQHHAFRLAGRARGIDDAGQFIRFAGHWGLQLDQVFVQISRGRHETRLIMLEVVQRNKALHTAHLPDHTAEFLPLRGSLEQHHFHLCIVDDIGDILRAIHRVQRNDHQAQRHRRLIEHHPLRAVAQHDRHAVALDQPFACQRKLPARHLFARLVPAQIDPDRLPRVEITVGDLVRRAPRPFQKQTMQGHRLLRRYHIVIQYSRHSLLPNIIMLATQTDQYTAASPD